MKPPYTTTDGVSTAAARCIRPPSWPTNNFARLRTAPASLKVSPRKSTQRANGGAGVRPPFPKRTRARAGSEEDTPELPSPTQILCPLFLLKKKKKKKKHHRSVKENTHST